MTREESQPLLEYLYARATRHVNIYRHKWRVGDVLMWDNRCAMHYAVRDYDDSLTRYLHRSTAAGDRPVYPEFCPVQRGHRGGGTPGPGSELGECPELEVEQTSISGGWMSACSQGSG